MAMASETGGLANFDPSGEAGPRWRRWRKSFEYYVIGRGIKEDERKKALLLHCAGPEVQEIFDTLPQITEEDAMFQGVGAPDFTHYLAAMTMLDRKFMPQANESYERHKFRRKTQKEEETVKQYIVRLKGQAVLCNFCARIEEDIRDQVVDGCRSNEFVPNCWKQAET
jgi:hypothetical protein